MGRHQQLAKQVETTIASFEHLVATDVPASIDELSRARVVLVQSVNAYIAYLGTLVADARADARLHPWKEAHARVVGLRGIYSQHIGRYSACTIATDWKAYRYGCRSLMQAMREHLREVGAWKPID